MSEFLIKATRLSVNFGTRKTVIWSWYITTLCVTIDFPASASSKRLAKKLYKLILALYLIWGSNFKSLDFFALAIKTCYVSISQSKKSKYIGVAKKNAGLAVSHQLNLSPCTSVLNSGQYNL